MLVGPVARCYAVEVYVYSLHGHGGDCELGEGLAVPSILQPSRVELEEGVETK